MSTLKDIIQRALGGEQVKAASVQSYEEATTPVYAATETEKLAASLEYLALNIHAIDTPAETKLAEFNEFLMKMAQDAAVDAMTQVPNDYGVDITGGMTQAAPVAMSNTILPTHIPLVAPPGDMSMTAIPTDDAALGEFHESMESPEEEMVEDDEEEEEAKVAGVIRIFEMLKIASALDNPPMIMAPRVDEPGLLLSTPDGLGTPAGGPVVIPEIQSNEAVINSSARAITQAHNDEMLQYISENGGDPTLDALLDEAKTAGYETLARGYMGKAHDMARGINISPTDIRAKGKALAEYVRSAPSPEHLATGRKMIEALESEGTKARVVDFLRNGNLIASPGMRAAAGAAVGSGVGAVTAGEDNRLRGALAGGALGGLAGYGSYHTRNAIYKNRDLAGLGAQRYMANLAEVARPLGEHGRAVAEVAPDVSRAIMEAARRDLDILPASRRAASAALTGAGLVGAGAIGGSIASKKTAALLRILGEI